MANKAIPALAINIAAPITNKAPANTKNPAALAIKAGPSSLTTPANKAIAANIPKKTAIAPPPALAN